MIKLLRDADDIQDESEKNQQIIVYVLQYVDILAEVALCADLQSRGEIDGGFVGS